MRRRKKLWVIGLAVIVALVSCFSCATLGSRWVLNWISFEIAWRVVNQVHFDPTFNGLDWQALHSHYRRQTALAGDSAYYRLVNEMLWKLNVSHLAVIPPGYWPQVEPTVLAEGSPGLDVRLFDGKVVITAVEPGSGADEAGLRPGLVIQRIDGRPVEEIADEAETGMEPPANERHCREAITSGMLAHLYGPANSKVSIVYLDEQGRQHETVLTRSRRPGGIATSPGFPSNYLEFESRRLEDGVGYIHFNWFHETLAQRLPRTIASMRDAPGLIIDLRGNPGGMRDAARAGVEKLLSEPVQCSTLRRRGGTEEVVLDPAAGNYEGPVVVLIDVMSKSSSEFFAACTQAVGRSVVIGERSPGSVGPAELMGLPNGAGFIFPVAQEATVDGTVLEGHGVIPDVEVRLDRDLLAQGVDSQLQAAIDYLEQEFEASR
ncbi:MAG: S41 family peptidase [Anaerolineae bacterium]|jgi:carboxyl-terminal processing protease